MTEEKTTLSDNMIGKCKSDVDEFLDRYKQLEFEMENLKEDQKNLVEEFKEKLDIKTLKLAIRAVKLQKNVKDKHAFDVFFEAVAERESI
jgi:uncharacterized protein (UPF0335 family)